MIRLLLIAVLTLLSWTTAQTKGQAPFRKHPIPGPRWTFHPIGLGLETERVKMASVGIDVLSSHQLNGPERIWNFMLNR